MEKRLITKNGAVAEVLEELGIDDKRYSVTRCVLKDGFYEILLSTGGMDYEAFVDPDDGDVVGLMGTPVFEYNHSGLINTKIA